MAFSSQGLQRAGLLNRECLTLAEMTERPNMIMGFFCNSQKCTAGSLSSKGLFLGTRESSFISICEYCHGRNIYSVKIARNSIEVFELRTKKKLDNDARLKRENEEYIKEQEQKESEKKSKNKEGVAS